MGIFYKKRKSVIAIFIVIILFLSIFIGIKYDIFYQPSNNDENQNDKDKVENNTVTISKNLNFNKPTIVEYKKYFKIKDDDADSFTLVAGYPRVPVYTKIFTFPLGTNISNLTFTYSTIKKISCSKKLETCSLQLSSQQGIIDYNSEENLDTSIFPKTWYNVSTGGGIYNNKQTIFFRIHIFPTRYSPSENMIYHIEKANITFSYSNEEIKPYNGTLFLHDFLIITPKEFVNSLQSFVEHKNSLGFSPKVVTVENIFNSHYFISKGRDKQEKIKYFIKNSIEQWGVKYVLLVGDKDKIPVRYIHVAENYSFSKKQNSYASISDLYYSDIYYANGSFSNWDPNNNNIFGENNWEGNTEYIDYYPDVYIGRLPCKTAEDVSKVTNKIIEYETNKNNEEWFNKIVLIGGDTVPPLRYLLAGSMLKIRIMLERLIYNTSEVFFKEGEDICNSVAKIMNELDNEKIYSSFIIPKKNEKPLTNFFIRRAINNGAGFVLYSGHGNPTAFATYKFPSIFPYRMRPIRNFGPLDILLLNNGDKLPFVILSACSCGKFDEKKCLAWDFVKKNNGGAIASIASTNASFGYIGSYNDVGLNGYMATKIFENYNQGSKKAGEMLGDTQIEYLNMHSFMHHYDYLIISIWELFGDPTLQIGDYN